MAPGSMSHLSPVLAGARFSGTSVVAPLVVVPVVAAVSAALVVLVFATGGGGGEVDDEGTDFAASASIMRTGRY